MTCELLSITGDAWEYFGYLKKDLLDKLKENVVETIESHCALKTTMTYFWDMLAHGSIEYTTRCLKCGNRTAMEDTFDELILWFPKKHHHQPKKKSSKKSDVFLFSFHLRKLMTLLKLFLRQPWMKAATY
jgi:hypothetical protein